ncbi:4-hydroxyphenylpyruvate dioxygenase [Halioxenophilus sp. WMMB6]|uniref:4-hydroxyphenylpyruvate dioxygenase n=1 Tax=Halioxenophilus sp. WMMB6 TaxID=3073815 RepID=UPI00295E651F|nr:4-hydroxyphenylpyruvate dioxygenase [Halioxenophilus sp. WMMB6]
MASQSYPVAIQGISFLEFSGSKPHLLDTLFRKMGFFVYPKGDKTLYNINEVFFISNPSFGGTAENFRKQHIRGASAMGFKVKDSMAAYAQALRLGAQPVNNPDLSIPAIKGVGASIIYLVDEEHEAKLFASFDFDKDLHQKSSNSILAIDHLTHNLRIGGINRVKGFYEKVFGFVSTRNFDIDGKATGLVSEVIRSPDGSVTIPLNESKDEMSQIAEFVREYNGEGIQHIALLSDNIFNTVGQLESNGIPFQDTPDTYYEMIDSRLPGHGQDVAALQNQRILIDGGEAQGGGYLLQIFTQNSIGPIFFEFIQRIGNDGFGEGNFQALFESIELDQIRRGKLV